MNKLFAVLAFGIMMVSLGTSPGLCDSLDEAGRSAESASGYAGKATYGRNVEDTKTRSRAVVSASSEARDAAIEARAYRAADYESQAYDYSRKAAGARTGEDARFFSKQAAKAAEEAEYSIDSDIAKRKAAQKSK